MPLRPYDRRLLSCATDILSVASTLNAPSPVEPRSTTKLTGREPVTLHLKTASFATVAAIGGPRSTRRARRCQRTKRSMPAFGWITVEVHP